MDDRSATVTLNTRKRLVNFRMTDEEYESMSAICERRGARSLSEFARDAIFRMCHSEDERDQIIACRLADLEGRVLQLEVKMASLPVVTRPGDPGTDAGG